jgi:hypothetical protein
MVTSLPNRELEAIWFAVRSMLAASTSQHTTIKDCTLHSVTTWVQNVFAEMLTVRLLRAVQIFHSATLSSVPAQMSVLCTSPAKNATARAGSTTSGQGTMPLRWAVHVG